MIKHLSSSGVATLAVLVFTAIGGIVSARFLLPSGKGELTAVILWPTLLVTLGSLGLTDAVTYFTATTPERSPAILSSALAIAIAASAVLVVAGYNLLPVLLSHYGSGTVQTARGFLLYVPVSLASVLMMAALQGNMRIDAYNVLRTMVQLLTVAGLLLAVAAGHATVRGFAVATLGANLITFAAALTVAVRAKWIGSSVALDTARPLLRFGLQSQLGSLASLLNLRLDQMLMSALMSASLLGIYVVGVTVAGVAALAPTAIIIVAAPRISGETDAAAKALAWGRLLRLSVVLQLVVASALWMTAPYIVRFGFGPSFDASTRVARILIFASLPLGANMLLAIGFRAFNRPMTPSAAEIVSLGATAIGLLLLLRRLGPEGAAWASLAAYSVTCAFMFSRVKTQLGIAPRELLAPSRRDWLDARAMLLRRAPENA